MDSLKLELLKNKEEHAQSAIASQEVREHLAAFICSKRQGSSTQISTTTSSNQHHQHHQQQHPSNAGQLFSSANYSVQSGANNGYTNSSSRYMIVNVPGIQDDDHPLRKTASMPTIHISYKAQSLSRRRQMERRTTMSPLMKRKSKPKRQLLQSQDSTEYSSNPCIIQSSRSNTRSLSQSSSPPPIQSYQYQDSQQQHQQNDTFISEDMTVTGNTNIGSQQRSSQSTTATNSQQLPQQQHHSSSIPSSASQTIKLSSIFTNRELESLQNSLYFPTSTASVPQASSSSSSNVVQQAQKIPTNHTNFNNNNNHESSTITTTNNTGSAGNIHQTALEKSVLSRQQQHLKVNEAIRKTVIQRASSKGKMAISGSLDSGGVPATTGKNSDSSTKGGGAHNFKDELRQLSLDGADLRTNMAFNKLASSTQIANSMFHRDFHKLRLATTSDAAIIRRSQSPSSSISMGLSGGQAAACITHQSANYNTSATNQPSSMPPHYPAHQRIAHGKHYSSSSSSTSSLLSQQDSLEESSSQAIDLSSSSEASRHHRHQTNSIFNTSGAHRQSQFAAGHLQMKPQATSAQNQHQATPNQHYQKVLQESFNQLQLCQSQEGMKHLLISSTNQQQQPSQTKQPQQPFQQISVNQQLSDAAAAAAAAISHPPSLSSTSKTATSLDASGNHHNNSIVSISEQFNISASAQNLISLHQRDQQQLQNTINNLGSLITHHQQQQQHPSPISINNSNQSHDLNQWLFAYNNPIQATTNDAQFSRQLTGALFTKLTSFPEPYRSTLLSHIIQQQQLGQMNPVVDDRVNGVSQHQQQPQQHHDQDQDQRSLISRTLSSPMLISNYQETSMLPDQADHIMGGCNAGQDNQSARANDEPLSHSSDIIQRNHHHNQSRKGGEKNEVISQDPVMMMDSLDESKHTKISSSSVAAAIGAQTNTNELALMKKGKKFPVLESNQHSLDLTVSSNSSSKEKSSKLALESSKIMEAPLNFSYTPADPKRASYNFIYNPIFDKHSSTGLIYELEMCNHKCICNNENNHPENSYRILAIWRRLYDSGLMAKCAKIEARRATLEEIQLCHSETYSHYFGKSPYDRIKLSQLDLSKLPIEGLTQLECGGQGADIDTAWNEELTPNVARLAVGCVIEAAINVAKGKLMNAFAVVRPPGHHAEYQQAMGFCFFNSVAIAAQVLISRHQLSRVLIVDWDVHHGNGIQKMFYEDKNVMYISLHRHDKGNFFPGTGDIKEIGINSGEGFNWNIAWSSEAMGDAEYIAAFRAIVMPIAYDFNPSMVIVACGFDAARGHPFNFGGYDLSPACFAHMTRQLMTLANGRLVLCLEGGYQLDSICDCAESCVRALLNESNPNQIVNQVRESELRREPNQNASEVLYEVSNLASKYWPSVERWKNTIELSALEAASMG